MSRWSLNFFLPSKSRGVAVVGLLLSPRPLAEGLGTWFTECVNSCSRGLSNLILFCPRRCCTRRAKDSGFVSLSRLGPCLRDKDLEMEELILQDGALLGTMHSYMDAPSSPSLKILVALER